MTELRVIIKDKLRQKQWTFGEIANVSDTINELADYAYHTMTAKEKLDLIWDTKFGSSKDPEQFIGQFFGRVFELKVKYHLQLEIAIIIKEELSDATIMFKENEYEISERSVGGEPHKERSTDEATDSEE